MGLDHRLRNTVHTSQRQIMNPTIICTLLTIAGLTSAAPSPYGTGVQPPVSRPAKQTSVQCRTEYTTIWDTKYQEKETQECVTVHDNVCKTVFERQCQPTTRQECNTIYEKKLQPSTRMCVWTSTRRSTSRTPRPSAPPCTRRTASTSGRGTGTTRSGCPFLEHARTIPMMSARR